MSGEDDRKAEDEEQKPVGGFAFFLSLVLLAPTAAILLSLAISRLTVETLSLLLLFGASAGIGAVLAQMTIKRHISVLLHETKHSIVSSIVGNKRKGMKIDERSGYFEYSYTKDTAHFNFMIALAPYILPVFTFLGVIAAFALGFEARWKAVALVGVAYGIDMLLNLRDISPIQTDISLIRGGYGFGVAYIVAWNITIFALLVAWVGSGTTGLTFLLQDLSRIFFSVHPVTREFIDNASLVYSVRAAA